MLNRKNALVVSIFLCVQTCFVIWSQQQQRKQQVFVDFSPPRVRSTALNLYFLSLKKEMLSSWVFFACRHVNLPPMRGEAPKPARGNSGRSHKRKVKELLKISLWVGDRVSMSKPLSNEFISKAQQPPVGFERRRDGAATRPKEKSVKISCWYTSLKQLKKLKSNCAGSSLHPAHTWNGSVWLLPNSTHADNRAIHPRYLCLAGDK